MYHLVNNLQTKNGDALVGYYVKLKDSEGAYASLYCDVNSTPIATVSGVADTAVTDANGQYDLYVADGSYTIEFFDKNDITLLVQSVPAVPMFSNTSVEAATDATLAELASTASGKGSALVGFKQAGTGAVARTAEAKAREVVSITDFGALGDDSTTNTTAIQAALTALSSGGVLRVPMGTYRSGALTVSNDGVRIVMEAGATLKFPTLGSGVKAITVSADNFAIEGGTIQGPASGVYVTNENAIHMVGAATDDRRSGLTVRNTEIKNFGAHGIYTQFVDDIHVENNYIHDCGYAGSMFLSSNHGTYTGNRIKTITPGTGGTLVMYGVSVTHDSTDYDVDANAGTKSADNPFSWDWNISSNRIEDIAWEGIDAHGAYEVTVIGNKIYATQRGISIANSSDDALNYAGWSNVVSGNTVDGRNADGTTSGREWQAYGINVGGAATTTQTRVVVTGNIVVAKGVSQSVDAGSIQALRTTNVVISNNIIDQWLGVGILATFAGGEVNGNQFGARGTGAGSDTTGKCIYEAGPTTYRLTIANNQHDPLSGTAALIGFAQVGSATVRPLLTGNRFGAAGTAFALSAAGFCLGTDVTPSLTDTASGTALDISALEGGNGVVHLNNASSRTISTFTGAVAGQRVTFVNIGAGTQTIDRTNARLDGGTTLDVTQYDVVELYFLASNDARQIAKMPSNG